MPAEKPANVTVSRRGVFDQDALDDRALADLLIADGRVDAPRNLAHEAELLRLVAQARHNLARSHGTFVMGDQFVRLFLLTRDDVVAAHSATEHRATSRHRSDEDNPDASSGRRFLIPRLYPAAEHTPRPCIPRATMPTDDVVAHLPAIPGPEPLEGEVLPAVPLSSGPTRQVIRPSASARIVLSGAAVLLAAAVATVLIAVWPTPEPTPATVAQTKTSQPEPVEPAPADPAKVKLARGPVVSYLAPPPPATAAPERGNAPQQRRKVRGPRTRTIPNPIPGLPPIVLPR